MYRNGTGFWLHYNAYNAANNEAELNDSANHTLKFFIDGVLSDPTNSPEDIAAGECRIFVAAAESLGAKFIAVGGISSTSDVYIIEGFAITDLLTPSTAFIGCYTAWNSINNVPKTGDNPSVNHSITIAQDGTDGGAIDTPSEISAVSVPGLYEINVTSVEADGHAVSIIGSSSTSGVNIIPTELAPFDVDYPNEASVLDGVDYAEGTLTGTLETTIKGPIKLIKLDDGIKVIKL